MGIKPDVRKLRIFCCKAYFWIPSQKKHKLDSDSEKCIMVGYAANGYRLWNITKQYIITSRDVKFETYTSDKTNAEADNYHLIITESHEQEGGNVCTRICESKSSSTREQM